MKVRILLFSIVLGVGMSGCGEIDIWGPTRAGRDDPYAPGAEARYRCDVSAFGYVTTPDGAGKSGVLVQILYPGGISIAGSVETDSAGFYVTPPQPAFSADPEKVVFRFGGSEHRVSLPKDRSCTHHEINLTWIW